MPRVFSLSLASDVDPDYRVDFNPTRGPDEPVSGTFSYESLASVSVNGSVPKGLRFSFSMEHGPRDAVREEHMAFVAEGEQNFPQCEDVPYILPVVQGFPTFLQFTCHFRQIRGVALRH